MPGSRSRAIARPLLAAALLLCGCVAAAPPAPAPRVGVGSAVDAGPQAAVRDLLESWVERGAFPGAVAAFGRRDGPTHVVPAGRLSWAPGSPPAGADTLYDLASLTKVLATTAMAMVLVDEGRLALDAPVGDLVPAFAGPGKDDVTVWHLLTHSSGLPAGAPLYRELRGGDAFVEAIAEMELEYAPGSRSVYSDLGFVLLGAALERAAGEPLESFVRRRVFAPLGMDDTTFRPGPELLPRIAPTEEDPWRGRLVRGEVHDENAWAMGGVAPHAGLFGTASDVGRFARLALGGGELDGRRLVSAETLARFTERAGIPGSDRAVGWDTKSAVGSSAGELFSPRSYGHLGFTGTSLWIDPERGIYAVLLTNRVHPTRDNALIRDVRPAFADAVVRALDGFQQASPIVRRPPGSTRKPSRSTVRVPAHRVRSPAAATVTAGPAVRVSQARWVSAPVTVWSERVRFRVEEQGTTSAASGTTSSAKLPSKVRLSSTVAGADALRSTRKLQLAPGGRHGARSKQGEGPASRSSVNRAGSESSAETTLAASGPALSLVSVSRRETVSPTSRVPKSSGSGEGARSGPPEPGASPNRWILLVAGAGLPPTYSAT